MSLVRPLRHASGGVPPSRRQPVPGRSSARRASTRRPPAPRAGAAGRWRTLFRIVLVLPALLVSGRPRRGNISASRSNGGGRASSSGTRRARDGDRGARLVREPREGPDAEGASRRRRVQPRLRGADARVPAVRHRPVSVRGPDGDARRRGAAAASMPVHLVGDPEDLRRSRLTVFFRLAAGDPAHHLARALGDRRVLHGDRAVVHHALRGDAGGGAAPLPVEVRPPGAPRLRVHLARRQPVPGIRG